MVYKAQKDFVIFKEIACAKACDKYLVGGYFLKNGECRGDPPRRFRGGAQDAHIRRRGK